MNWNGIIRRRHLPHWDVEGAPHFITACLEGSIPAAGMKRIQEYRAELDVRPRPKDLSASDWEHYKDKLMFAFIDELLDHHSPVKHLADDRQAEIVQNAFRHFADERYLLLAFVVMPSHHHWLFLPNEDWVATTRLDFEQPGRRQRSPREIISHSIQSYTAKMCNRIRGQSGSYWQMETYDHWVRDEDEMFRIIDYIEQNPVRAGLVDRPDDWPWSSARVHALNGTNRGDPILKPLDRRVVRE